MSSAEFDRLVRAMQQHSDLLDEFEACEGDPDRLLQWAQEKGYYLTREEMAELAAGDRALADDELEQVAGGDDGWGTGTGGGG
jgi:predicted ribosomally synthesized peptide with nif11-like leader